MGWNCSWAAVRGATKDQVLAALKLVETGHDVHPGTRNPNVPYSCSERENGWVIVVSEDGDFSDRERVRELSRLGFTLGCYFEEHVANTSQLCAAQDGVELWYVYHDTDPDYPSHDLEVTGNPPAELAPIRERIFKQQEEDPGVDWLADIPVELAKAICGYRLDDELTLFTGLRSTVEPPRKSFFARLLTRLAGS